MRKNKLLLLAVFGSLLFSNSILLAAVDNKIIMIAVNGTNFKVYDDSNNEKGSTLSYYDRTKTIHRATLAEDITAKAGGLKVAFKGLTVITFYENGNIAVGVLAEDLITNSARFKMNRQIKFTESGEIEEGTLATAAKINGVFYKGLTKITFYSSGKVKEGYLANTTTINGIDYGAKKITYHDSGQVYMGRLEKNTIINGYEFKGSEIVSFYKSGKLNEGTLAEDIIIGKYTLPRNTEISFYESGNLKKGRPYGEFIESNGIKFLIDSRGIYFYESGKVQAGYLAEDVIISKILYKKYAPLKINEDGNVLEYGGFAIK